eukprot:EG_transcript_3505
MAAVWDNTVEVTAITVGGNHIVVLAGGTPYAVGDNSCGQLGDNSTTQRLTFVSMVPVWGARRITLIAASCCLADVYAHTVVIAGGLPYAVGDNTYGQLGDGTAARRRVFVGMAAPWSGPAAPTAIAAGAFHTAVVAGGQLFVVGRNHFGQLGLPTTGHTLHPVAAPWGTAAVTAVAASAYNTVVLADGQLYGTGRNDCGLLADGTRTTRFAFVRMPHAWNGSAGVRAIAVGTWHSMVLAGGKVFAVGYNGDGELGLGNGSTANQLTFAPMETTWDPARPATAVAAGFYNTAVLAEPPPASPSSSAAPDPTPVAPSPVSSGPSGTRIDSQRSTLLNSPARLRPGMATLLPSPSLSPETPPPAIAWWVWLAVGLVAAWGLSAGVLAGGRPRLARLGIPGRRSLAGPRKPPSFCAAPRPL